MEPKCHLIEIYLNPYLKIRISNLNTLKVIGKKNPNYNRLSLTQKYISDLLNKNKKTYNIVKDNYLQIVVQIK